MVMCSIKIHEVGDPPVIELTNENLGGILQTFVILEKGMESGRTSVAFHAKIGETNVILQTSAEIFRTLYSALQGAEGKFARKNRNNDGTTV